MGKPQREVQMIRSVIQGVGYYVPPKVVTNHDLAQQMSTSDEWIVERTGIKERRYTEDGVGASDLAFEASKHALARAGLEPKDLDLIILATLSPDRTGLGLVKRGAVATAAGRSASAVPLP